jgi:hypothetical protein
LDEKKKSNTGNLLTVDPMLSTKTQNVISHSAAAMLAHSRASAINIQSGTGLLEDFVVRVPDEINLSRCLVVQAPSTGGVMAIKIPDKATPGSLVVVLAPGAWGPVATALIEDHTRDGRIDSLAIDTKGDGKIDKIAKASLIDTTGDGLFDSLVFDSTGDGRLDRAVAVASASPINE